MSITPEQKNLIEALLYSCNQEGFLREERRDELIAALGTCVAVAPEPIVEWPRQTISRDQTVPEPGEGGGWIQWKGTDACVDFHCKCGAHGHVDAEFLYFYKCNACGRTFSVGQTVRLYEIRPDKVSEIGWNSKSDPELIPGVES